jgi:hypothetical protein
MFVPIRVRELNKNLLAKKMRGAVPAHHFSPSD